MINIYTGEQKLRTRLVFFFFKHIIVQKFLTSIEIVPLSYDLQDAKIWDKRSKLFIISTAKLNKRLIMILIYLLHF